jgi:two-component system nitrogen regulation response regulator GlnG
LNGFTITIPPLRERGDDIVLLLERFFNLYARQLNKEVQGIAPDALKLLVDYPWPGNVREMQSAVRRALLQTTGPVLVAESLPEEVLTGIRPDAALPVEEGDGSLERLVEERLQAETNDLYAEALAAMEIFVLTRVLRLTHGNQSHASRILGITRGSLRNKIHTHAIHIDNVIHIQNSATDEPAETVGSAT